MLAAPTAAPASRAPWPPKNRTKQANRRNALKSTGSKTPEAKAAIRPNPVKHGLTAQQAVATRERAYRFNELLASYEDHFQPVGPFETLFVQQIVMAAWRRRRTIPAAFLIS